MSTTDVDIHQPQHDAEWSYDLVRVQDLVRAAVRDLSDRLDRSPPIGSIIPANLSADNIAKYFDSTGLGKLGDRWDGWAICNGNNDTPSLDGKFPRFETSASGGTGGSDTNSHTHDMGNHTHDIDHNHGSFTSGSTTLTISQIPAHTHTIRASGGTGTSLASSAATRHASNTVETESTGGGNGHTHSVNPPELGTTASGTPSSNTTSAASDTENRPAYFELVPVMRVA